MSFKFNAENLAKVNRNIANYPPDQKQSAILFILHIAQKQNGGWLSKEAIEYVAQILSLPVLKVYEVASFYSMYNLSPVGKYHVKICTNIVCMLRGSDQILQICKKTCSNNSLFTVSETECLGACVNAPVVQINDSYYENLNQKQISAILLKLK